MSCPSFKGVHRQVLLTTVGWFLGYHLSKYENYFYAKLERDMNQYIELHPEEFAQKGQQIITVAVEDLFRELEMTFLHAFVYMHLNLVSFCVSTEKKTFAEIVEPFHPVR